MISFCHLGKEKHVNIYFLLYDEPHKGVLKLLIHHARK